MKIEKIIYEKDEKDNVFNKCTVYYENNTTETTNNVLEKIMDFMNQEGLSFDNVMNDPRIIDGSLKKEKEETNNISKSKTDVHHDKIESTVTKESSVVSNGEGKKKNGKRRFIKITSLATALVLAGATISYFINKNKSKTFSNNKNVIEQNVGNNYITPDKEPLITQKPIVVEKNDDIDENYNEVFRDNVEDTIENIDPLTRNVMRLNSGEKLSEDELLNTLNGINRLCQANMAEVEKLIEGGNMSGDKIFPLFDEMFPKGSLEYEVISHFTSRRNMLVNDAYYGDSAATLSDVNDYSDFFLDYIFGDTTFEYNNQRYGYYDISPIARYIVFMLGQTTLETNHNYEKNINGNMCDFDTIINELEENYNLITSQLFQGSKTK